MSCVVECQTTPVSQSALDHALAEAYSEIARLTAECDRVKEELKEALVGVTYGRMCERELVALRARKRALPRGLSERHATSRISLWALGGFLMLI